jgi:flagellar assembly protein FliH
MVHQARAEAQSQTERRLKEEYEQRAISEGARIRETLEVFAKERAEYFVRVEAEVVHLALAIAGKILHREAQVDRTLLAALVRVAVENMNAGSSVSVRVRPEESAHWRKCLNQGSNDKGITVIEDSSLDSGACVLETQLGSTDFSIDAQLKEVEHGFLDLLAQRPA